jgi:type II secretory pathway pseudopilin PulG
LVSRRDRSDRSAADAGFAYIGLLAFIAVCGIALAGVSLVWTTVSQREREEELLFIGQQFRTAIARYRERNQTRADHLPRELDELLKDDTQVPPQRYLRKLFVDPMTGKRDWGLVRAPGGGIMGVYSTSKQRPLRKTRFPQGLSEFADAKQYSEWRFVVQAQGADENAPGQQPAGGQLLPGGQSPAVPLSPPMQSPGADTVPSAQGSVPVPVPRPHQAQEPDRHALPSGEAPLGEAPPGEAPLGEAPSGEAPLGEAPSGETPPEPEDLPTNDDGTGPGGANSAAPR